MYKNFCFISSPLPSGFYSNVINLYNIFLLLKYMKKIDIKTILLLTFLISNISVFGEIIQTIGVTSDGNITSSIKPQGTSMDKLN